MKTVSSSSTFFVGASVHADIDVHLFKKVMLKYGVLKYIAIPLDIIFLTYAGLCM